MRKSKKWIAKQNIISHRPRLLETLNREDTESLTYMSLAVFVFHLPWRWEILSFTPEFAAIDAPPDLVEWVLYFEMSGTISLNDALKDSL